MFLSLPILPNPYGPSCFRSWTPSSHSHGLFLRWNEFQRKNRPLLPAVDGLGRRGDSWSRRLDPDRRGFVFIWSVMMWATKRARPTLSCRAEEGRGHRPLWPLPLRRMEGPHLEEDLRRLQLPLLQVRNRKGTADEGPPAGILGISPASARCEGGGRDGRRASSSTKSRNVLVWQRHLRKTIEVSLFLYNNCHFIFTFRIECHIFAPFLPFGHPIRCLSSFDLEQEF